MRLFRWVFLARSRRSICRGLMDRSCRSVAALSRNRFRIHGIQIGNSAFSRTRVTGRFPNGRQDGQCFLAIAQRTSPRPPNGLLSWGRTVQKPNRVFPVVAGVETEFVQDHMFYPVPRLAVTLIDGSQVLPFRLMAHRNPPQKPSELGYILNGAITPPRVTF